jgi:cell division protein FtsL
VIRLNGALALLLVLCALALVTAQHKARKLFSELAEEQSAARQIDVEWGQLQLEQSTWAMHARIERIASSHLQMRVPVSARTRLVRGEDGYEIARSDGVAIAGNATQRGGRPHEPGRSRTRR